MVVDTDMEVMVVTETVEDTDTNNSNRLLTMDLLKMFKLVAMVVDTDMVVTDTDTVEDTDTNNSSHLLTMDLPVKKLKPAAMVDVEVVVMVVTDTVEDTDSSSLLMTVKTFKLATLRNSRSVVMVMADTSMVDTDTNKLVSLPRNSSLSNRGDLERWKLMSLTKGRCHACR
jgi:hypothetical protein